ncbi:MAG: ROK family protein [Bifidobacteriaceae bacterium]|nr:ROK family protein [Bifidobacteriaceae bacterium]
MTISDLVAELHLEGLIAELGARAEARVGKPANLIDINSDGHVIAVLDLSDISQARGALMTLRGDIRARAARPTGGATGEAVLDHAAAVLASLMDQVGEARLLGVGVAAPGVVRPDGLVIYAKDYEWHQVALPSLLRDRLRRSLLGGLPGGALAGSRGVSRQRPDQAEAAAEAPTAAAAETPIFVGNDANLRALAEFTFAGAGAQGLMEVSLTDGLGAGILLDGVLLLGPSYAAGEIGHIPAMAGGEPCTCGRRGCLETVLNRRVLGGGEPAQTQARQETGVDAQAADDHKLVAGDWGEVARHHQSADAGLAAGGGEPTRPERPSADAALAVSGQPIPPETPAATLVAAAPPAATLEAATLARIGESTAAVLGPIVSAFNLSDLVFADPRGLVTPEVLAAIRSGLEARLLPQIMADLDVRLSKLGADAALLGAGSLVLAERLGLS